MEGRFSSWPLFWKMVPEQDGPSLESSSYFMWVWDIWSLGPLDLRTLGPSDSWTSSLLQHLLILPLTSSYLLLSLPPTLLLWYGLVRGGGGRELWHWRVRLEMDLWPIYWGDRWNPCPTPYFRPHLLLSLILPLAGGGHQQLDFCTPGIEHHGTLGLQDHCTLGCSGLTTFKGQLV